MKNLLAQTTVQTDLPGGPVSNIGDYVSRLLTWVVPILGGVAVLMIIYAGYLYMTSQGNQEQIGEAKNIMIGVITGILLLFLIEILMKNVIGIR